MPADEDTPLQPLAPYGFHKFLGEEVVRANLLAMEKAPPGACYNIGTGQRTTDQRIFDLVRAAVGANLPPIYGNERRGEVDHICLDCRRVERELSWRPEVPLDEGIRRAVAFYTMAFPCL